MPLPVYILAWLAFVPALTPSRNAWHCAGSTSQRCQAPAPLALGAYGAHALRPTGPDAEYYISTFDRASRYHLTHSLLIAAAPLARCAAGQVLCKPQRLLSCGLCLTHRAASSRRAASNGCAGTCLRRRPSLVGGLATLGIVLFSGRSVVDLDADSLKSLACDLASEERVLTAGSPVVQLLRYRPAAGQVVRQICPIWVRHRTNHADPLCSSLGQTASAM